MRPLALALAALLLTAPAAAQIRVIDGDTIDVAGEPIRIMGLDTPETWRPGCAEELAAGKLATARARELVGYPLAIEEAGQDRYKRTLARVYVLKDGKRLDWAEIMIGEGLAQPWPKTREWC